MLIINRVMLQLTRVSPAEPRGAVTGWCDTLRRAAELMWLSASIRDVMSWRGGVNEEWGSYGGHAVTQAEGQQLRGKERPRGESWM